MTAFSADAAVGLAFNFGGGLVGAGFLAAPRLTAVARGALAIDATASNASGAWVGALAKAGGQIGTRLGKKLTMRMATEAIETGNTTLLTQAVATRLAKEATAAEKLLATGSAGGSKKAGYYQRLLARHKAKPGSVDVHELRMWYGHAVQDIAVESFKRSRLGAAVAKGARWGMGSVQGIRSGRTNRPLRPDVEIDLRGPTGVVDFTSRGSAGKALTKYGHDRSPDIFEVLYRMPRSLR